LNPSFEQTPVEVCRQTLLENADVVELGTERYPVRRTPKRRLRQVDFVFDGNEIRNVVSKMRRKVTVVGGGFVGSTTAREFMTQDWPM
jgi:hypothetical protein